MTRLREIGWISWLLASIFYAYQYILRIMPSMMIPEIMQQFHINATLFGQFSGVYYLGYSLMHIPMGIMLDRYGPRRVMTGSILLTGIGLLPLIFSHYWAYPIIGRGLIGIGSSAAILGTFKIIRMTFKEKHFTRMLSIAVTIGLLGAIYGGAPVSRLFGLWGYTFVIGMFCFSGMILALMTYLLVPELSEAASTSQEQPVATQKNSIFKDLNMVFSNYHVILLCFFAGCMVGPLEGFADIWGAEFLRHYYGLDPKIANALPSMIFIGMCFGAPLLSLIAEKTGCYLGSIVGAGMVMTLIFVLLVAHWLNVQTITLTFLLVGVCSAYQILAIYQASTYVPEHVSGLTTAVANMIIMSFGYMLHSLIGLVIHEAGGTAARNSFAYGIGVIPIMLLIGVVGCSFLLFQDRARKV
ncbi:MAG: MFS transporter [Chthoniobacterales bacterium]